MLLRHQRNLPKERRRRSPSHRCQLQGHMLLNLLCSQVLQCQPTRHRPSLHKYRLYSHRRCNRCLAKVLQHSYPTCPSPLVQLRCRHFHQMGLQALPRHLHFRHTLTGIRLSRFHHMRPLLRHHMLRLLKAPTILHPCWRHPTLPLHRVARLALHHRRRSIPIWWHSFLLSSTSLNGSTVHEGPR